MPDDSRHAREMQAAIRQIKDFQSRASRRWRLDVSLGRLAAEGMGVFVLAFLVGCGLAMLFQVFRDVLFG